MAVGGLGPAHGDASNLLLRRKHLRHHGRPRYEMGRCGTQPRVRVGVGRGGKVGGGTRSSRPTTPRALRNSRAASTAVRRAGYAPSVSMPLDRGMGTGQRWRLALALLTAGTPRQQNLHRYAGPSGSSSWSWGRISSMRGCPSGAPTGRLPSQGLRARRVHAVVLRPVRPQRAQVAMRGHGPEPQEGSRGTSGSRR